MALIKAMAFVFFWPGGFVSRKMGTTAQEDGGVLRSFVNMVFWGAIFLVIAGPYLTR